MLLFVFPVFLVSILACADQFDRGDQVEVYVKGVSPLGDRDIINFHRYKLPVCRPNKVQHRSRSFSEILEGEGMAESMYRVRFLERLRHATLCRLKLGERDVTELRHAIENSYNFEFIIDGLKLQNLIGFIEDSRLPPHNHKAFMWTHHHFSFQYNKHHIISVNITVSRPVELHHPPARQLKLKQTYSVDWSETAVKYENRLTIHGSLLPMTKARIPHLATYGPPFLALLICILALVHLWTTLNKDLNNNTKDFVAEAEKCGWKWTMNAGIIGRPPRHPLLLSCFLGTGTQLVCCGALALVTAPLFGHDDDDDRPRRIFCLTIYSAGSLIGGYVSCRLLKQSGRACDWVACVHVTCALFTAPCLLLCPPTKLIATAWLFIGYPLTVLGAIAANHSTPSTFDARLGNGAAAAAAAAGRAHKGGSCSLWRPSRGHLIAGLLAFACLAAPLYYAVRIGCTERPSDSFLMAHAAFGLASAAMVVATASVTLTYGELSGERLEWCWRCAYGVAAPAAALLLSYVLFLGWFFSTTASCWYNGHRAVQFLAGALLASCGVLLALGAVGFWATFSFVRYVQLCALRPARWSELCRLSSRVR